MEKKAITMSRLLFIAAGFAVIACMFLNWMPDEVEQISKVFGNVNALTLYMRVNEFEESVDHLASLLPDAFEQIKAVIQKVKLESIFVALGALITIVAYLSSIVLPFIGKEKYVGILCWIASIGAITTSLGFRSVIESIGEYAGLNTIGYNVLINVIDSPCVIVMLGGIISACCTDAVTEWIEELVVSIVSAVVNIVSAAVEWINLIVNNIGYVASNVIGGVVGACVGGWLSSITESTILAVICGMAVAGLVAYVCMKIVEVLFLKQKGPK